MKKIFSIAITLIALSTGAFAQSATATATASATIIAPLAMWNVSDMNFGNIMSGYTDGAVILTPDGFRTANGGVTLPPLAGIVSPAVFRVNGQGNATYAITLPIEHTIYEVVNGGAAMLVNDFTSIPSEIGILEAGEQWIQVGATLRVQAGQPVGIYTSPYEEGFQVTVNYN